MLLFIYLLIVAVIILKIRHLDRGYLFLSLFISVCVYLSIHRRS